MLDRARVRRSCNLRFDQLMNTEFPRIFDFSPVPLCELFLLFRRQHGKRGNLLVRIRDDCLHHRLEMSSHPRDGGNFKEFGAIHEAAFDSLGRTFDLQFEIALCGARAERSHRGKHDIRLLIGFPGKRRRSQRAYELGGSGR